MKEWDILFEQMIAEGSYCEYKASLELARPKSWLKSVSAFANGAGGMLIFGVRDEDRAIIGLENPSLIVERLTQAIVSRIEPQPDITVRHEMKEGKDLVICTVKPGPSTPYYLTIDNTRAAYIRLGDESLLASTAQLNELILKGRNQTFDSIVSTINKRDCSFSLLQATYLEQTGERFDDADFVSFGLVQRDGLLTNAGLLFSDQCPFRHARAFCTRWNGVNKSSVLETEAVDDKEYQGNIIYVFREVLAFIARNNLRSWKKTAQGRDDTPDYSERAYFEGIVNAIIHRSYSQTGSEIHVDIYDDRMTIWSPGGMYGGEDLSKVNLSEMQSNRRNPVIADLFNRMHFMERRGSGFRKIITSIQSMPGYREEYLPLFQADSRGFSLTMKNMNFRSAQALGFASEHDTEHDTEHDAAHDTEKKILVFCAAPRSRADIMEYLGLTSRPHFMQAYLKPLIISRKLLMTLPDKPESKNQRYLTAPDAGFDRAPIK